MMAADAPQHLFNNLTLLQQLKPGSADFAKCIKENMFLKPNRTAFDQVLYYLCSTYDPVRYLPKVPWPILERSQERTFRQNTVSFVKDIIKEVPEARIPPFSPSFLSTPGGERLTKFMWKFSLLVLKTVIERESDEPFLNYPTAGLDILQNLTESKMEEYRKEIDATTQLIIDASTYAKKLSNDLMNQSMELKTIRAELSDILQRVECPLTGEEKTAVLDGDKEQADAALARWQSILDTQTEQASMMLNILKDKSLAIINCYESVKALVNSKTMPIVLDATSLPSNVKDADGKLDLAFVLSEGAKAATSVLNSINMCGGFQPLGSVVPQLEHLTDQLQTAAASLAESKAGFMELLSECLENTNSSASENDKSLTPLKGSLQRGYEMLQDAQTSTPPLVFDAHVDGPLKSRISAESPTIDQFPNAPKLPTRGKLLQDVTTPKTFHHRNLSGFSSTSFVGKAPTGSIMQKKDTKAFKGFLNMTPDSPMVQTPAFNPKQNATSTACKSSPFENVGKKSNTLHVPSMKTRKIQSFQTPIASVEEEDLSSTATVVDELAKEPEQAPIGDAVLAIKREVGVQSPISMKKDDTNSKILKIQKTKEAVLSVKSPQLVKTPVRSLVVSSENLKLERSGPKLATPAIAVCSDPFDSPQTSCEVFSPPSANNSFFSMDAEMEFPVPSVPKFELDFDDDISPSGRVSLCPPIVEKVVEETSESAAQSETSEKPSSRRKSVNALINRYRDLVASFKPSEPQLSPPLSPETDLPEESISDENGVQIDINLDDLKFDDLNV